MLATWVGGVCKAIALGELLYGSRLAAAALDFGEPTELKQGRLELACRIRVSTGPAHYSSDR
eukprot:4188480-Pyramimonas_sp.AAC.1